MLLVGCEGIAGFVGWLILLPLFQVIPCSNTTICTNGVIEDSIGALKDFANSPILCLYTFLMVLSVPLLNVSGMSVTKYGSAAQRTTCDMLRNVFVWVFFMSIDIQQKDGTSDELETFSWL